MVRKFTLPIARYYGVRLYRIGCNNRPFYLIGAMHKRVPCNRDAGFRPDEVIGSIDPLPNEHGEHIVACDLNRLSYYIGKGARLSALLQQYLGLAGFLPMHPKLFINAWRTREGKVTRRGIRPSVHPMPRDEQDQLMKTIAEEMASSSSSPAATAAS